MTRPPPPRRRWSRRRRLAEPGGPVRERPAACELILEPVAPLALLLLRGLDRLKLRVRASKQLQVGVRRRRQFTRVLLAIPLHALFLLSEPLPRRLQFLIKETAGAVGEHLARLAAVLDEPLRQPVGDRSDLGALVAGEADRHRIGPGSSRSGSAVPSRRRSPASASSGAPRERDRTR